MSALSLNAFSTNTAFSTLSLPVTTSAAAPADDMSRLAKKLEQTFLTELLQQANIGLLNRDKNDPITNAFDGFSAQMLSDALMQRGGMAIAPVIEKELRARNAFAYNQGDK